MRACAARKSSGGAARLLPARLLPARLPPRLPYLQLPSSATLGRHLTTPSCARRWATATRS